MTEIKIGLTLDEAAAAVGYGSKTLRRAIRKTADNNEFPPPLRAKRGSKGEYRISPAALQEWFDSLEDA